MPTEKKIQSQTLHRSFLIQRDAVNEENRTVEVAFSSEEPYQQWYGTEILDHDKKSVDLKRLQNAGPVLCDHDRNNQVGVVESARIDKDKVGRAIVRFSKNNPRADQEFQDVLDGIRQHISVGYRVHECVLEKKSDKEPDIYRAVLWEPYEISFVSMPADTTVGVGRSQSETPFDIKVIDQTEERHVTTPENLTPAPSPAQVIDAAQIRSAEQGRVREILAIGQKHNLSELAMDFVSNGKSADEFRSAVLDSMGQPKVIKVPENAADIGMSEKETKNYSIVRAIHAAASGNWKEAGLEREASLAVAQKAGKDAQGFFVPNDIQRRDLTAGTATAGGHTVSTDLLTQSFIDLLRNKMVTNMMGAQTLSGLNGNIAIPRQTGGATAYWVAESGAPTESQPAFDQVAMNPKTVGAYTDISRKLLLQSSIDVEAFVRNDLATVLALAMDLAGINGSGSSNQPTGILQTAGIGSVAGGTNGAAPDWSHVIDLESAVANVNADIGSLGYITNTKVRGVFKQTQKATNLPFIYGEGDNPLNGYKAGISNQVPSNLTKGTASAICSAIIFGNFADLIYGLWGVLDVLVDPYTASTSGTVRVVTLQDMDVAVRHAQSFAAMVDALA